MNVMVMKEPHAAVSAMVITQPGYPWPSALVRRLKEIDIQDFFAIGSGKMPRIQP
jgi:hypothetical protein